MSDSAKQELLREIEAGWQRLQAFINSYTEEQLTTPTDAAGWTAKDHLIHLAVWQGGMLAVMDKQSRREYMQISREDWATLAETYDVVNGAIQQRHKDMPLDAVCGELAARHREFLARIESMPAEDLQLPYSHYQSASKSTTPLIDYLRGNSFGHYDEHIPWMRALMEEQPA